MSLPGNGIFVVQGEMSMLVTAMRRSTRWGSHSFPNEEYDVLMRTFQDLKTILNQVDDLRLLDPATYLSPFLEVIRSKETTGPVTSLALSAIHKFLSYGLIDPTHPSVPATVEDIADAVTHARFVGTDHSSDGVVLMKILQVLRTLMLSPEGAMLTDESVCEIMLSCFRICFETRLTELLRRNAEQCLRDMTQLIFMRLPQFPPEDAAAAAFSTVGLSLKKREKTGKKKTLTSANSQTSLEMKSSITEQTNISSVDSDAIKSDNIKHSQDKNLLNEAEITIEPVDVVKSPKKHGRHSSMDLAANGNTSITQLLEKCVGGDGSGEGVENEQEKQPDTQQETKEESVADQPEPDGVTLSQPKTPIEETAEATSDAADKEKLEEYVNPRGIRFTPQQDAVNLQPYGLACVRELFRFLISLCNPLDSQNSSAMVHLGLSLVGTALEVAADQLATYPSLLYLVKDPLCRNLLSLLSTERISIFALDLQVTFLLFEALRFHLKFQVEAFFKKIIEIISADTTKAIYELKEIHHLAIESIIQLFRIPGFCTELYLNYDCDVYCMNAFEEITKLLSKNVVSSTAYNIHSLSLEALLTIIEAIETGSQVKDEVKEIEISNEESEKETRNGRCGYVTLELGGLDDASVVSDHVTHDISQYVGGGRSGRHKPSADLPTEAELDNIKNMKKWVTQGTELFNQKPERGIEFLQEHGVLATPLDPHEVAIFLRENPDLDKKMIGEYICKRSSRGGEDEEGSGSSVLGAFADSFDYAGLRIEQALRLYLETFRLPGEAPLIFLVMERFAERWHSTNGEPFANTDAAFRLAYAVIMLNMDQHNHNAKKLNVPMTVEDFVKNLRGCNGSGDFDQTMLEQIFHSIKNEEMVMPAERVGQVREAYLWRVLQRRGAGARGRYRAPPPAARLHHLLASLFALACPPAVTALSAAFERAAPPTLEEVESGSASSAALQALAGLERCAALLARTPVEALSMDTLLLTLCKFTGLLAPAHHNYIAIGVSLGQSLKCQAALRRCCWVWARHAHAARRAWPHLLEILRTLYLGRLLPKCLVEAEDYLAPSGTVSLIREAARGSEAGLLSSLYSYIALGESGMRAPTPHEKVLIDAATECVAKCNLPGLLITETKFLPVESLQELVRAMVVAGTPPDTDSLQLNPQLEDIVIFFLELLGQTLIQNRDRLAAVWQEAGPHMWRAVWWAAGGGAVSRALTCVLRSAARLMRCELCAAPVLQHLTLLFRLPYKLFYQQADVISCGVYELVKTSAQNVHSAAEWDIVFALLCAAGAGAWPNQAPNNTTTYNSTTSSRSEGSEDESERRPTSVSSESELSNSPQTQGWILVNSSGSGESAAWCGAEWGGVSLRAHRAGALRRCAEALALVVRDVAHVTPYNCRAAVRAVRIFAAAAARHGKKSSKTRDGRKSRPSSARRRGYDDSSDEEVDTLDQYHMVSIQLLDLMHTLHSRTAQIFKWWRDEAEQRTEEYDLWDVAWKPLLQGIATFCTDRRKQVANSAIAYLQRALLVPGLSAMGGAGWEACFESVLFPLLEQLPRRADTAARANTIMCKVFLQHLPALCARGSFAALWARVVRVQRALVCAHAPPERTDDALTEAALESLKNMILVMDSVRIFSNSNGDGYNDLWYLTWEQIGEFLPTLKEELFPEVKDNTRQASNLPSHMQPSLPANLPTLVPLGPSTPTILPQPRPIQVQTSLSMTQSPILGQMSPTLAHSPVNLSQTPPMSTPTLVAPTPVSGMVPIRNPLYDQTGLTSSVLLQPLNEMISTPIGVSLQSQMPILYPQTSIPPPPKPQEPVATEQQEKIDQQLPISPMMGNIENNLSTLPPAQNIEHQITAPQNIEQVTPPTQYIEYQMSPLQQTQYVGHQITTSQDSQNVDNQMVSPNIEHQVSTLPRIATEPISTQNNIIIDSNETSSMENIQQSELYADYLTNPYNENELSTKEATLYEPSSLKNPLLTIIDHKSYSENTTPKHSNKTHFGSTDNVRQESSIFNFSSYFGSSQGMGASEIFDTLMSTQEG